ncbi:hypothetical protein GCM10009844_06470 [Nocardioides koreensis]|uniref:Coenzyme Q-binding protein COQ10 START domain-containing protein n=1 Tax=Nocardioides koreensis TaxID=433651 RepID=A0ABP5KZV4_9ACTN
MANTSTEGMDKLKLVSSDLMKAVGDKAMKTASDRVGGITDRLEGIADGGPIKKAAVKGAEAKMQGDSPVGGAVKGLASGIKDKVTGGGGKGDKSPKATKATNIIESIDVGVPVRVAYNQWTEFGGFPSFMKKVEKVEAQDDNKLAWKAQIVWSHRTWEASILEQIPDERIVWKSKGEKGHVDGAVTFHELGPNLTRILIVLEYYPQGLFERTGNIWRAQGRRVRAEFKHFRRHVMTRTILEPDEVEGWRGTIEDGEVVQTHEEALEEEQQQEQEESEQSEGAEDEGTEDYEDEYEEGEEEAAPEDEYEEEGEEEPEAEYEEEPAEDEGEYEEEAGPEDEYEEEGEEEPEAEYEEEPAEEEPVDEDVDEEAEPEEDEEEPEQPKRRRRRAS